MDKDYETPEIYSINIFDDEDGAGKMSSTTSDLEHSDEKKRRKEENFQILCNIFPDANIQYLRNLSSRFHNFEKLREFIDEKVETGDYPTDEFTIRGDKNRDSIKEKFDESFDIIEYMKRVPNPPEKFNNPDRMYSYNFDTVGFLKNYFNRLKTSTILNIYMEMKFNIHKTFGILQNIKFELETKRKKTPVKTEVMEIFDEFTYVMNKKRIERYIENRKEQEERALEKIRRFTGFLTCECCFQEVMASSEYLVTCSEGHTFCVECVKKGTKINLEISVTKISCFADCNSEIPLSQLQRVLEPDIIKRLIRKIQEEQISSAGIEGLVTCPFCHFALVLPDDEKIFKCMHPECGKQSCRLCRKVDHWPKECEISEKNKRARLILEERMTKALVRICSGCDREYVKDDGCNHVTCYCGVSNCYYCGFSSASHEHLNGNPTG